MYGVSNRVAGVNIDHILVFRTVLMTNKSKKEKWHCLVDMEVAVGNSGVRKRR